MHLIHVLSNGRFPLTLQHPNKWHTADSSKQHIAPARNTYIGHLRVDSKKEFRSANLFTSSQGSPCSKIRANYIKFVVVCEIFGARSRRLVTWVSRHHTHLLHGSKCRLHTWTASPRDTFQNRCSWESSSLLLVPQYFNHHNFGVYCCVPCDRPMDASCHRCENLSRTWQNGIFNLMKSPDQGT